MGKLSNISDRLTDLGLHVEVYKADKLPVEYLDQLIKNSRQPHVLEYEEKEDAEGRFKDREAFKQWSLNKKRIMYLLLENKKLAGVIWFGERINPNIDKEYSVTFAIRIYEGYFGKGLSKPFMQAAHDDAEKYYPGQKIWLDFVAGNIAAKRAYESFGYVYLGEHGKRIIMGYK